MMEKGDIWEVIVFNTKDKAEQTFLIEALDYKKERLIEILSEIHPEYDNIRLNNVVEKKKEE
tara:strand:- start:329 stop:514 length:186 start_codon:yes stop_codon:yes gene_type:complete